MGENSGVLESNARVSRGRVRNKMAQNIMDTAAEKEKDRQARITKDKDRLQVGTRTQPSRGVVANADAVAVAENEFSCVNSSSEDIGSSDSDFSDDSHSDYNLTDMVNSMAELYSDTELQESDAEEILQRFKIAKKNLRKKRDQPVPLLQRLRSRDCVYQQCTIELQE